MNIFDYKAKVYILNPKLYKEKVDAMGYLTWFYFHNWIEQGLRKDNTIKVNLNEFGIDAFTFDEVRSKLSDLGILTIKEGIYYINPDFIQHREFRREKRGIRDYFRINKK